MKKFFKVFLAAALICAAGASTTKAEPSATITCSSGTSGRCMVQKLMQDPKTGYYYYGCKWTGYQKDYCSAYLCAAATRALHNYIAPMDYSDFN